MTWSWLEIWAYVGAPITVAAGGYLYVFFAERQLDRKYPKSK